MSESLWEENTDRVHHGHHVPENVLDLLELGVGLANEFWEHDVPELLDDDEPLISVTQEVRVAELLEARVLVLTIVQDAGVAGVAFLPLPPVKEEVVPLGLGLPHHHIFHPIHRYRRTGKEIFVVIQSKGYGYE